MRKIQLMATMALLAMVVFTSCSHGGGGSSSTPSMTATISGAAAFNATVCLATNNVGTILSITGSTVTGGAGGKPQIALDIADWSGGAGTWQIANTPTPTVTDNFGVYNAVSSNYSYSSTSGTITITSVSSTIIKGTFSFKCADELNTPDSVNITNGVFTATRM